jgi:hypothetical protein
VFGTVLLEFLVAGDSLNLKMASEGEQFGQLQARINEKISTN